MSIKPLTWLRYEGLEGACVWGRGVHGYRLRAPPPFGRALDSVGTYLSCRPEHQERRHPLRRRDRDREPAGSGAAADGQHRRTLQRLPGELEQHREHGGLERVVETVEDHGPIVMVAGDQIDTGILFGDSRRGVIVPGVRSAGEKRVGGGRSAGRRRRSRA